MSKNFCYYPWAGLEVSTQGELKPCCKYDKVISTDLREYFKSTELEELKQDFMQGKKPKGCKRCWNDEESGILSKRQIDKKYFIENNYDKSNFLQILNFSFGNSCNLACRTCNSYSSSGWIREEKKILSHIPVNIYKHQQFYKDVEFMDEIKKISSKVHQFEFIGGETFISGIKEHLDFLDFLLESKPENISLRYITNATVFPNSEFWSRWKKFKLIDIQVSIDGTKKHFEYTRWPANWDTCFENVQKYLGQRKVESNLILSVSHVVSIFTVYYLPEFFIWCLQNNLGKPYLGMLQDPVYYNIKALPSNLKSKLTERLKKYSFQNVTNYMNSEDLSDSFEETIKITKLLDSQRNQCFIETFSEFNQMLMEE